MEFQEFLNKVRENEEKRLKFIELEVTGIGNMVFTRPKNSDLLEYITDVTKSSKYGKDGEVEEMDYEKMVVASNKLVYNSCGFLQKKEIRDEYKNYSPYDIPSVIFGFEETIRLASEISDKFGAVKAKEELEDDIKN